MQNSLDEGVDCSQRKKLEHVRYKRAQQINLNVVRGNMRWKIKRLNINRGQDQRPHPPNFYSEILSKI